MKRSCLAAALLFRLLALLFPLVLASSPGAEGAGGGPLSLDAYRQAIDRARDLVAGQEPEAAAGVLVAISAVELADGQVMPVDHGWFVSALRSDRPDLDAVSLRLEALRYELDAWPSGSPVPGAFDRLAQVLARPEFQPRAAADLNPLREWLDKLLGALPDLPGMALLGKLLLIGAVVALAGVVAYLIAGLRGSFVARAGVDQAGETDGVLTAGQALSRSRDLARAGDYRTAVRLLYLSTLLRLEERNLLRYDRTLTNREYLGQVAGHPALAAGLRPVVDTFDEVWYGEVQPDAARYEAYSQQVDRLREVSE
jgi:hypothetical protein